MKNLWKIPQVKKRFDELNTFYSDTVVKAKKIYDEYYDYLIYIIENKPIYQALALLLEKSRELSEELYNLLYEEIEELYFLDTGDDDLDPNAIWCNDELTLKDRFNKLSSNIFSNLRQDSYTYNSNKDKNRLHDSVNYHVALSKKLLSNLVISELNHALVKAVLKICEQENTDLYMYISELDEKTCDICWQLNGEVFDIEEAIEGINLPLMHTNCRCTITPFK